jgi:hypothetical protein
MKKIVVLAIGGLCILLAVVYGFSGLLVPSIQSRGTNITRWESEIVKDKDKVVVALAEADALGKQPATTNSSEKSPFERKLEQIDRMNQDLRRTADMIDYERGRRKEMLMITAAFAVVGVLALLIGLRLRR